MRTKARAARCFLAQVVTAGVVAGEGVARRRTRTSVTTERARWPPRRCGRGMRLPHRGPVALLPGANPYGPFRSAFASLFQRAAGKKQLVRVFVHSLAPNPSQAGTIDSDWTEQLHGGASPAARRERRKGRARGYEHDQDSGAGNWR